MVAEIDTVTCHCPPTICGRGDVTVSQSPNERFVRDCKVKLLDARGQDNVKFVSARKTLKLGGACGAALAWGELELSPARLSAETT